jgi:ubiquinone/menaquinone biosynthesis C-methylase UbiE
MRDRPSDPVKAQVAAHWDRRAANFDNDFGHSIAIASERAAWDRIIDLVLGGRTAIDALDCGCGTGFLSFELAARGHRVTGVDFAPSMLEQARAKMAGRPGTVAFEQGDAEQLRFGPGSFDVVVCRHVLWTLPHPEAAVAEWVRVLRPGGRVAVIDSQFDPNVLTPQRENARDSSEYAAIGDRLPFLGGRPREEIEGLFARLGLVDVGSDPVADLVAAQAERMALDGREPQVRRRYVAWGDKPR